MAESWGRTGGWEVKGTFRKVWRAGDSTQSVHARPAPARHKRQPDSQGPGFLPFSKRELIQGTQSCISLTKAFFQSELGRKIALL